MSCQHNIWLPFNPLVVPASPRYIHMLCWVTQSCLTLCDPIDCSPPDSSLHGDSPSKNTGVAWHFFLQGSFLTWGLNWGLHHCRHSLPSEPPGKPENAGVGSLSLLQGIFLTWELNQGLLHCRWILYQLSFLKSKMALGKWALAAATYLNPSRLTSKLWPRLLRASPSFYARKVSISFSLNTSREERQLWDFSN